jgi:hypothetical protein
VIESIEAQDMQGKTMEKVFNDPYHPNYLNFRQALFQLMRAGITVEQVEMLMPVSAPMDSETVNRNLQGIAMASANPGTAMMPVKLPDGRPGFQVMRMMPPDARICLQREAADETLPFRVSQKAYCKSSKVAVTTGVSTKPEVTLIIKLRSVRNIFEFLGNVVNLQNSPEPRMITVVDSANIPPNLSVDQILAQAKPLFIVKKGSVSGPTLTSVTYQDATYSIPRDDSGATYTNQVLVMLSQMLTLTKVPGSIPLSPAVLIK